jgi:hypothetical protein
VAHLRHRSVLSAAVAAAVLLVPAIAQARPVTVNLRVEGPTATVFEGRVTTDVRTFRFTDDPTPHRCDGTASTGGMSATPVPVRNGALVTAAEQHGFALLGSWSSFGPSFDRIGDQPVAFDPATSRFMVEYKNGRQSELGGCSEGIATGDDLLYAYAAGTEPLLKLTAPAKATPGRRVTVRVTDTAGKAVAGAAVGGRRTAADGRARVLVPTAPGPFRLKASKPGTIRSNRATVCVTDGSDGVSCPAADNRAPRGRILSIRHGRRFAHGHGPRRLAGRSGADASGIADVRLRLTRTVGSRCQTYDARSERLVRTARCGARQGRWFSVGQERNWRYVLPARLGRGRWVLDLSVVDGAGNAERKLRPGRTRVVFSVR